MRLVAAASLLLLGCLPAYDNGTGTPGDGAVNQDLSGATDDGGDGGTMGDGGCGPSGKKVTGAVYSIEMAMKVPGPVVYIDGYPQSKSAPASNTGSFSVDIPQCALGASNYFRIEGSINGTPILPTWIAPKVPMTGSGPLNVNTILHPYRNQSDMMGVRGVAETELKAQGVIPMSSSLASDYSWSWGWLVDISHFGSALPVVGATVQVSVPGDGGLIPLDNTNCKPDQQCCVFYTEDYSAFRAGTVSTFIDFGATTTTAGWALVVCPGSETGDITLAQTVPTASLHDYKSSQVPTKDFPTITAPRAVGDGVFLDWQN